MNAKHEIIIFALLLIFPLACEKNKSEKVMKDNSYFPLAVGNYWEYKQFPPYEISGHEIRKMRVVDTVKVNDTLFFEVTSERSHTIGKLEWLLYKDSMGNIWAKDSISGSSNLYLKKLTKDLDYTHYSFSGDDSVRINFVSEDTIEVPAGVFECLKFKVTPFNDTTIFHYNWYSKGVGLIKAWFEIKDAGEGGEILIKAKVNGIKYP